MEFSLGCIIFATVLLLLTMTGGSSGAQMTTTNSVGTAYSNDEECVAWVKTFPECRARFNDVFLRTACRKLREWLEQAKANASKAEYKQILTENQSKYFLAVTSCENLDCVCDRWDVCVEARTKLKSSPSFNFTDLYNEMRAANAIQNDAADDEMLDDEGHLPIANHHHQHVDYRSSNTNSHRSKRQADLSAETELLKKFGKVTRKEIRMLNEDERTRFFAAMNALKTQKVDNLSKYDIMIVYHTGERAPEAHGGAAFLPFHREFLKNMEISLRLVDPQVAIPYWDSGLDEPLPNPADSVLWSSELYGTGDGDVVDGPFGNWTVLADDMVTDLSPSKRIFREVGKNSAATAQIINDDDVKKIMAKAEFRNLVLCVDPFYELTHGANHLFVGGHMIDLRTSPNDPAFFGVHGYVDFIWEQWRQSKSVKVRTTYVSDNETCNPYAKGELLIKPFTAKITDGLSDTYLKEFYSYQPPPKCSPQKPSCGESPFIYCDVPKSRCLSKIRLNGNCTGYDGKDICYKSSCVKGKCVVLNETTIAPTTVPTTPGGTNSTLEVTSPSGLNATESNTPMGNPTVSAATVVPSTAAEPSTAALLSTVLASTEPAATPSPSNAPATPGASTLSPSPAAGSTPESAAASTVPPIESSPTAGASSGSTESTPEASAQTSGPNEVVTTGLSEVSGSTPEPAITPEQSITLTTPESETEGPTESAVTPGISPAEPVVTTPAAASASSAPAEVSTSSEIGQPSASTSPSVNGQPSTEPTTVASESSATEPPAESSTEVVVTPTPENDSGAQTAVGSTEPTTIGYNGDVSKSTPGSQTPLMTEPSIEYTAKPTKGKGSAYSPESEAQTSTPSGEISPVTAPNPKDTSSIPSSPATVWFPITVLASSDDGNASTVYPKANIICRSSEGKSYSGKLGDPNEKPYYTGSAFASAPCPFSGPNPSKAEVVVEDENGKPCTSMCLDEKANKYAPCKPEVIFDVEQSKSDNVPRTPNLAKAKLLSWNGKQRTPDKFIFICNGQSTATTVAPTTPTPPTDDSSTIIGSYSIPIGDGKYAHIITETDLSHEIYNGGCLNLHRCCSLWATGGECPRNLWMQLACEASCNVCSSGDELKVPEDSCLDFHPLCPDWGAMGLCSTYPAWMEENCRKTCNVCSRTPLELGVLCGAPKKAGCQNYNSQCDGWAKQGECERNLWWMKENCPLACKTCSQDRARSS